MMNSRLELSSICNADLLVRTRQLVGRSRALEAELVAQLGEIDERRLYREHAFPSMFAFCVGEYGFSEQAAYNRITVARAGRQLPAVIEALRSGQVHLGGLRLLVPHLTAENHGEVLAQAAGKTTREIEELIARLVPKPEVPTLIRKIPNPVSPPSTEPLPLAVAAAAVTPPERQQPRSVVAPLSELKFKVQFTASRALHDKMRKAQGPLRHRIPDGDLAAMFEKALDVLIEQVKKERFAVGRNPRPATGEREGASSRHIPNDIKRQVYERDGGRCTFTDQTGRRCAETRGLELDHLDGFARNAFARGGSDSTPLPRAQPARSGELYGRTFMQRARERTRLETNSQPPLFDG